MAINGMKCNIVLQEFSDIRDCIEDLRRIEEELHELVEVSTAYAPLEDSIRKIDDAADEIDWILWNDFMSTSEFMEKRYGLKE